MLLIASLLWLIFAYPIFKLLLSAHLATVIAALVFIDILSAMVVGAVPAALTELFSSSTRYTGVAFAYNVSLAIFGGLTPLCLVWLSHNIQDQTLQSINIIVAAMMCLIAAIFYRDKSGSDLS
jgi:sugar phosphate permease